MMGVIDQLKALRSIRLSHLAFKIGTLAVMDANWNPNFKSRPVGQVSFKVEELAGELDLDRRSVGRAIKELKAHGLREIKRGRYGEASVWQVAFTEHAGLSEKPLDITASITGQKCPHVEDAHSGTNLSVHGDISVLTTGQKCPHVEPPVLIKKTDRLIDSMRASSSLREAAVEGTGYLGSEALQKTIAAMDRWSKSASPLGRGYVLNTTINEHRPIQEMLHQLAQRPPVMRGGRAVKQHLLAVECIDRLVQQGKQFKKPAYACGIVKSELDDWQINGIPTNAANGSHAHAHVNQPMDLAAHFLKHGAVRKRPG